MHRTLAEQFKKAPVELTDTQRFLTAFMKAHEDEHGWLVRSLGDGTFRVMHPMAVSDAYIAVLDDGGTLRLLEAWDPFEDVYTKGQESEVYIMYKDYWLSI